MADDHEQALIKFGYRCGRSGAHASRTMMLAELSTLLANVPPGAARCDYRREVVDANTLDKPTRKARQLTFHHLVELYGLDPSLAVFRVFRQLWNLDEQARPVLALMVALVRDPLLRLSRDFIRAKYPGESVQRAELEALLATDDPDRFTTASRNSFA